MHIPSKVAYFIFCGKYRGEIPVTAFPTLFILVHIVMFTSWLFSIYWIFITDTETILSKSEYKTDSAWTLLLGLHLCLLSLKAAVPRHFFLLLQWLRSQPLVNMWALCIFWEHKFYLNLPWQNGESIRYLKRFITIYVCSQGSCFYWVCIWCLWWISVAVAC